MGTNKRIVSIVDDELDISELFHDALSNKIAGISVVSFNDPVIALEHFTANKKNYALVIADLRMPGLNGMDYIKKIKDLNPLIRTILMTPFAIKVDLFQAYAKQERKNAFLQETTPGKIVCRSE
jgi:DNA-binding NtrC family response regulator